MILILHLGLVVKRAQIQKGSKSFGDSKMRKKDLG